MFAGKLILTLGFSNILSSIESFSSVTLNSTSSFGITVDKFSLFVSIDVFKLGSSKFEVLVFSFAKTSCPLFFIVKLDLFCIFAKFKIVSFE